MGKYTSGRHGQPQKFEVPLVPHALPRDIWSPQPLALIPVAGPLVAGAPLSPAYVRFFVDTGADITVIPRHIVEDVHHIRSDTRKSYNLSGLQTRAKSDRGDVPVHLEGYLNYLTIQLCGIEHEIPYVVAFDERVRWSVLGRAGVIDVFRISVGNGLLTIDLSK